MTCGNAGPERFPFPTPKSVGSGETGNAPDPSRADGASRKRFRCFPETRDVIHSEGVHLVSASTGGRWTVSSGTLYRRLTVAGRSPTNTRASGWATDGDPTTRPGPVPC